MVHDRPVWSRRRCRKPRKIGRWSRSTPRPCVLSTRHLSTAEFRPLMGTRPPVKWSTWPSRATSRWATGWWSCPSIPAEPVISVWPATISSANRLCRLRGLHRRRRGTGHHGPVFAQAGLAARSHPRRCLLRPRQPGLLRAGGQLRGLSTAGHGRVRHGLGDRAGSGGTGRGGQWTLSRRSCDRRREQSVAGAASAGTRRRGCHRSA